MNSQQLTDSQLVILSAAASRPRGNVLPLPATLTLNKGSAALVIKSLMSRGLILEQTAGREDEVWRECEDGGRVTIRMTEAAFRILGLESDDGDALPHGPDRPADSDTPSNSSSEATEPVQPGTGTKLAIILQLLRKEEGASLEEIVDATGWLAHSVRGAISGSIRKKLGLDVEARSIDVRGRVYRIVTPPTLAAFEDSK